MSNIIHETVELGLDGGPLYRQIRAQIVRRIADGVWPPGEPLPSEFRLADEFGVSQGTVRKALDALASENVVVRRQGKGTFVAQHTHQRALFHFFHLVGDDGTRQLPETGRVLNCRRTRANRDDARHLDLADEAPIIEIERIRMLSGTPAILERIAVAARLFAGLETISADELPNELYRLYETEYGVTVHRAIENLRPIIANRRDASFLDIRAGRPMLEIHRVALTVDGVPVERRISRCDTRRHSYLSEIV